MITKRTIKTAALIIWLVLCARLFMAYDPGPWTVPDYSGAVER